LPRQQRQNRPQKCRPQPRQHKPIMHQPQRRSTHSTSFDQPDPRRKLTYQPLSWRQEFPSCPASLYFSSSVSPCSSA
jgi:hypothetical protein